MDHPISLLGRLRRCGWGLRLALLLLLRWRHSKFRRRGSHASRTLWSRDGSLCMFA